ncbi:MAG: TIGR00153 family protein [Tissierellales bacterium]|jgi:predicted phosphate transport protein (TIGR00153 family)|nr:TIGR00153 family protein [Tissierellales bacterium]
MNRIFKKSIELNMKIEKFLDTISEGMILFEKEINAYLSGDMDTFKDTMKRVCDLESEADNLETEIKINLYKFMLLPDTRADVLSLIKSLDDVIDALEEISKDFGIQKPRFPEELHKDLNALVSSSLEAADSLLLAARAFFNEVHLVSAHTSKVKFYEHETDIIEDKIEDKIFNGDNCKDLAEKMQLKEFVNKIAGIADEAEIIGDKLTIFTIKREI